MGGAAAHGVGLILVLLVPRTQGEHVDDVQRSSVLIEVALLSTMILCSP